MGGRAAGGRIEDEAGARREGRQAELNMNSLQQTPQFGRKTYDKRQHPASWNHLESITYIYNDAHCFT